MKKEPGSEFGAEGPLDASWDDIRLFLHVARTGSATAAARSMGVNHTTIGRRLRALEERVRVPLFTKVENRLSLTPEGELIRSRAEQMELASIELFRSLDGRRRELSGEISITVTEGLGTYWLLPALQPFLRSNPHLKLILKTTNIHVPALEEADLALRWSRPTEPEAVVVPLGNIGYSVFATQQYAQRYGLPASFSDLKRRAVVEFNGNQIAPDLTSWVEWTKQNKPAVRLDSSMAVIPFFKSNEYVSLQPNYVSLVELDLVAAPITTDILTTIWLCYHESRRNNPLVREFSKEIRRLAKEATGTWLR